MKYRYPKISNALTYQRIDDNSFEVVDHLTDNCITFGINAARYVRKLDGFTHLYKIPSALSKEEIDDIIKFLDKYDLVRHSAICNGFIGVLNLTFIKGLDETAIVSDLLGVDNVIDCARNVVFNRKVRKKIICQGSSGCATVTMCYMLFVLQIVLPVLLITNVLEVLSCFV